MLLFGPPINDMDYKAIVPLFQPKINDMDYKAIVLWFQPPVNDYKAMLCSCLDFLLMVWIIKPLHSCLDPS